MERHSSFTYCMLIKFLVTPESRSAIVLALFWDRWMNRCNCIDFHIEKYILSDPVFLIQATWIRPLKNFPPELPFMSSTLLDHLLVVHWVVGRGSQLLLSLSRSHCPLGSSQLAWLFECWCTSVLWGNHEQSGLVVHNWSMHPVFPFGLWHHQLWQCFLWIAPFLFFSSSL